MINPIQIRESVDNRIMKVPSTLKDSFVSSDGVRYDLFAGIDDPRAAVRHTDEDSGMTIGIQQYPTLERAEEYFNKHKRFAKTDAPKPPLGTVTTHDTGSAMVGM